MKTQKILGIFLTTALFLSLTNIAYAAEWAATESTLIASAGDNLHSGYEPSGSVWHEGLNKLVIVGDDGDVSTMDADGSNVRTWSPGGDLEGITLIDENSEIVYLANESNAKILEFDLNAGALTGTEWDLKAYLGGDNYNAGLGIEALTYAEGSFFVGLQEDGDIYQFNLGEYESVTYIGKTDSPQGYSDISGLNYNSDTKTFYAIYDSAGKMFTLNDSGELNEYSLPGDNQEGIAINEDTYFIAEDSGEVWSYTEETVVEEEEVVEEEVVEEEEPELAEDPDYSTIEDWEIDGDIIEVTYESGDIQEITIIGDKPTRVFTIARDSKLVVLNGRMLLIFSEGELIYNRLLPKRP